MGQRIERVEGIGPSFGEKLRAAGVTRTDQLLEVGRTRSGRRSLAERTGIPEVTILGWVNMVDLCRIAGVGPEFAELLEAAGVDTVRELARRSPEALAEKCAEVNAEKRLTRRTPAPHRVKGWIEEAKLLPPLVEH